MLDLNPKCNCMSAPKYHRDDCVYYENNGILRQKEIILENLINKGVESLIDKDCPLTFKLEKKGNYYKALLMDKDTDEESNLVDFKVFFGEELTTISNEIFKSTGDIISFD